MLMKAPGPGQFGAELADVGVALAVGLGKPQEGHVKAAAVIEVELRWLVDQCFGVGGCAEIQPAGRDAADDAGFGGQGDEIQDLFLIGHTGEPFGHADAEVDDAVAAQFEGRPAGDDLAVAHLHGGQGLHRHPDFAAERRVVDFGESLPVVLGGGLHDTVHQDARDFDIAGIEAAALGDALDLHDNEAAGIARGRGNCQGLQGQGFALHGDIAVGISRGAPQNRDVDGKGLVGQVFPSIEADRRHQLLCGTGIDFTPAVARIHKGAQAHRGNRPRFAGGDVPVQV